MRPRIKEIGVLLALILGSASSAQTIPPYQEKPGVQEFSGRLIARPFGLAEWERRGLSRREAAEREFEARAVVEAFEPEFVEATREFLFSVPVGRTENHLAQELLETGLFEYVEPDWILFPVHQPNDPDLGLQYGHQFGFMRSFDAWMWETGKPTETVAICDTGILTTHEDLLLHRKEGYNAVDQVWESAGGDITPVHDHGTQVTGCAAANGNNGRGIAGMGWSLSHRMMRVSNSGGSAFMSVLTHAARTAAEAGDRAINVSYTGVESFSVRSTATYIKSLGGLLFWAAANDDVELDVNDRDADDVIVVGATDEMDVKWAGSNWGRYVDLAAPGSGIWTTHRATDSSYTYVWGTSYASPMVAGLAALIWSHQPNLTPDEMEDLLKRTCDDMGAPGLDDVLGYGRINSGRALLESLERRIGQTGVETGDLFGWSVDRAGELVVVGAPGDDDAGSEAGAVYVYRDVRGQLTFEAKLVSSVAQSAESLGWSVATDGTSVFAGAPLGAHSGTPGGKVNVYRKETGSWVQKQTLLPADVESGDQFGHSLDVDGATLVVGAPHESEWGSQSGAAYTFAWDGVSWGEEQKLVASDGVAGSRLGQSVSVRGDFLATGAYLASPGGAVYVYERGVNWGELTKLAPADTAPGDSFGFAVALAGDVLVVGAPNEDDLGSNSGAVHIYRRSGSAFDHEDELHATDGEAGDLYGFAVTVDEAGNAALASALLANENDSGTVYVNRVKSLGWIEEMRLFPSNGEPLGFFGNSVAFADEQAIVGARSADDPAPDGGSAALYDLLHLRLTVDPSSAGSGEAAVLHLSGSEAGALVLTYAIAVDDVPFLFRLFVARADSYGDWIKITSIPPGLSGFAIQLMCFSNTRDGKATASNAEVLTLK